MISNVAKGETKLAGRQAKSPLHVQLIWGVTTHHNIQGNIPAHNSRLRRSREDGTRVDEGQEDGREDSREDNKWEVLLQKETEEENRRACIRVENKSLGNKTNHTTFSLVAQYSLTWLGWNGRFRGSWQLKSRRQQDGVNYVNDPVGGHDIGRCHSGISNRHATSRIFNGKGNGCASHGGYRQAIGNLVRCN